MKLCEEIGILLFHLADVLADDIKLNLNHVDAHLLRLRESVSLSFSQIDSSSIAFSSRTCVGFAGIATLST
jgi:hypothetical protein